MVVGLCNGVVIVAMIVAAEVLVADMAKNQEGGSCYRDAPFAKLAEQGMSGEGCRYHEPKADQPVEDDTDILMRATTERQGEKAGWEDDPEQDRVEALITEER